MSYTFGGKSVHFLTFRVIEPNALSCMYVVHEMHMEGKIQFLRTNQGKMLIDMMGDKGTPCVVPIMTVFDQCHSPNGIIMVY